MESIAVVKHIPDSGALHPFVNMFLVQLDALIRPYNAHITQVGQAEVGQSVRHRSQSDEAAQSRIRRSLRGSTALGRGITAKCHFSG